MVNDHFLEVAAARLGRREVGSSIFLDSASRVVVSVGVFLFEDVAARIERRDLACVESFSSFSSSSLSSDSFFF